MRTEDYRVRLDAFDGPMDLLLYLIRKNELEIEDIPIGVITEQYLRYLEELEAGGSGRIDIEVAGEFLVMAATLMEIKSRVLSPRPVSSREGTERGGAEDPRAELVQQLLAYKKFRDAAEALERRGEEWGKRFPARAGSDEERLREVVAQAEEGAELEDLSLLDLVETFGKIAATVNFERLGEMEVAQDETPVEIHAADIVDRLSRRAAGEGEAGEEGGPGLEIRRLLSGRSRPEMVGLFLALLQLVREQRVGIRVERSRGEIFLELRSAALPEGVGSEAVEERAEEEGPAGI